MKQIEWFVVANATGARVLSRQPGRALQLERLFEHPGSRLKTATLGDDKAGREVGAGHTGGATYQPRTDPHRKEHEHFARELADWLEEKGRTGAFETLSVFAGSPFLGELKQALGRICNERLAVARDLDLTHVGLAELDHRVREAQADASDTERHVP